MSALEIGWLADLAPALLIFATVLAHVIYFSLNAETASQHAIRLRTFGELPPHEALDGRLRSVIGDGVAMRGTDLDLHQARLAPRRMRGAEPPLEREVVSKNRAFEGALCGVDLVCAEDLRVSGATRFLGSVNVTGDLFISGDAVFEGIVVVDGYIQISGSARFEGGLVCRSDVLVSGQIEVGSLEKKSWIAARRVQLAGNARLNGRIFAREGIHRSAA